MGPGIDIPGKDFTAGYDAKITIVLQWGPGLISRERLTPRLCVSKIQAELQWGPGLISRESPGVKGLIEAIVGLQWGPGLISREREARQRMSRKREGFNGARD